jgi:saccharopine dehydrogenase-like NADP-dependent oxidoreductase
MARIIVLGGAGEMGSAAVADLAERTSHELVVGDVREVVDVEWRPVDVEDAAGLRQAIRGFDVVVNATYMRQNVGVTRAAIDVGAALVDLGSYWPETLQQLEMHDDAVTSGARIVPGCGVAPGLSNVLARHGADRLDRVDAVRIYSYITHPMYTSPGIVITRFDASVGTSLELVDGRIVERPSFSGEEEVEFPDPYGRQHVHLVPHPEPVTLRRSFDVRNVVFKVGYPADENRRISVLLELGFDLEQPFTVDGVSVSPRAFAAAYIGSRGIGESEVSANVKRVIVSGSRAGEHAELVYDFAVEHAGASASSRITGTFAAICADLLSAGAARPGVQPPEEAFDPPQVLAALEERGLPVTVSGD